MFFPLYIDLNNKEVLIIGGGKLGYRKARTLKEYGAHITVYSEEIREKELKKLENVKFISQNIENDSKKIEETVKDYYLVVAATDNQELNDKIAERCIKNNILINNVSSRTNMNAMFGAIVKNDEFHVAVSTNGKNCRRSRALKTEIEKLLDKIKKLEKEEV